MKANKKATRPSQTVGKAHPPKKTQREARPSPEAIASRLARLEPSNVGTAAVDALREMRDVVPVSELRRILYHLKVVRAVITTAAAALSHLNADYNPDIATTLRAGALSQIDRLERLVGQGGAS